MDSAHDRPRGTLRAEQRKKRNVGQVERFASVLAGAALAAFGARRRDAEGTLLALAGGALVHRGVTGRCPVYRALGMSSIEGHPAWLEQQHGAAAVLDASHAVKVERSIMIDRPASDLYEFWRDVENLPLVLRFLESVQRVSDTRSRWRAKAPKGVQAEWEAEVINDIPNRLIAWKSTEGAPVPNAGSVHFTSTEGRGTSVRVVLEIDPDADGGAVGRSLLLDAPEHVRDDLRAFKRMMEAGARSRARD